MNGEGLQQPGREHAGASCELGIQPPLHAIQSNSPHRSIFHSISVECPTFFPPTELIFAKSELPAIINQIPV